MGIYSRSAPGAAAGAQPLRIQHPDKRAVPLLVLLDGRQLIGQPVRTHLHPRQVEGMYPLLCSTDLCEVPSTHYISMGSLPHSREHVPAGVSGVMVRL